ncbi:MAG TPA: PorP/SprF family type IX secretion system membrane protein [Ferruginibacter sp.]|nr:PorP/SprF family type IX secretion system membrane protein [Ferruginibacter sp.]HRO06197.1 PorP/SprF family type IX secretion system membrane protein [Ferruginibacter sp.]HRO96590.1 PorP/SprF family type IX secretion system membrane protein [Ferruginibacter sp.]HRP49756.1 PorP/SprF family type IX secretion system membrane protein [Ferruginibacter sp.]
MKNPFTKILLCIGLTAGMHTNGAAQDIHFSQMFETPLLRNPALAGVFSGDVRIQSVYRTQWNSVTTPYQTVSINGEFKMPVGNSDDFLTVGGQVLYDKAGTVSLTSTHILPALNYHKSLSDVRNTYLSFGFMGGWVQRRIDVSKMTTNNQFDGANYNPNLGTGEALTNPTYAYWDASVGMSFLTQISENEDDNFFVGFAYHHLNRPKKLTFYSDTEVEMMPKMVASAGVRINVSESAFITIEADHSRQGPYNQTIAGTLYTWKLGDPDNLKYLFHVGSYVRWKDAVIPVAKLEFRPLSISASYDANISPLKSASSGRGGFEMSLTYQKYINNFYSSRDAVRCPKF